MVMVKRGGSQTPLNGENISTNNYQAIDGSTGKDKGSKKDGLTISYEESLAQVPWQTDNDYILKGYRRQIPSLKGCLKSAFTYLHNETINIHTHSIGALFFLTLVPLHLFPTHFPFTSHHSNPLPVPPTLHDKVAVTTNLLCAVTCLGLSSWFHTVQCHSKATCDLAHSGDYVGIVVLTTGSIVPSMYYAFYNEPILRTFYMGAIITAGVGAAYVVLSPHHRAHRWHRTLVFIGLGLTAVFPVIHVIASKGLTYARQSVSLDLVLAGGASYIIGAVLYAARLPEKLSPGTFDFFGASHQIFHCFVLGGAGLQYLALRGMVWGRSMAVGS